MEKKNMKRNVQKPLRINSV